MRDCATALAFLVGGTVVWCLAWPWVVRSLERYEDWVNEKFWRRRR